MRTTPPTQGTADDLVECGLKSRFRKIRLVSGCFTIHIPIKDSLVHSYCIFRPRALEAKRHIGETKELIGETLYKFTWDCGRTQLKYSKAPGLLSEKHWRAH